MRALYGIWLFLMMAAVIAACSGQKRSGSNPSWLKLAYHDLTARDNAYFNAKLKLNSSIKKLEDAHKDNYEEILPFYKYGSGEAAKTVSSEMDEVIKKSSSVIQFHSVSKWIDDSYLLIGKANYFKGDFDPAILTFQYIVKEFSSEIRNVSKSSGKKKKKKKSSRKKKKKKKKPASSKKPDAKQDEEGEKKKFLNAIRHQSARNEALLWLIKTFIEAGKYTEAEVLFSFAEADEKFGKRFQDDMELLKAHYFLRQKDLPGAIAPLEKSIGLTRSRKSRVRQTYILAQIHHRLGNNQEAKENYEKVLKLSPNYEMEFYAKINLARNFQSDLDAAKPVKRILKKMARNEKFADFRDQIYYTLAEIALKDRDEQGAIKYLLLSVRYSTTNNRQKALSFLKLGELYFDKEDYVTAQPYYDSTLAFIDRKHEKYAELKDLNGVLKEIVDKINIIHREDSLQLIAELPSGELNAYLSSVVEKMLKESESVKEEEKGGGFSKAGFAQNARNMNLGSGDQANTQWYFYNPQLMMAGYSEFAKKWGTRKLADDWRRTNLNASADNFEPADSTVNDETRSRELIRKELLESLPISADKKSVSNEKIMYAMLELGGLYQQKLGNYRLAIETFGKLNSRFPENKYFAQVLYSLYLLYLKTGDSRKAEACKAAIINDHGQSVFARLLEDPAYMQKTKDEKSRLHEFYEETYRIFNAGRYQEVIERSEAARKDFPDNKLQPKFDLLAAMAVGGTENKLAYIVSLEQVVAEYPKDEVKTKAEEILKYLKSIEDKEKKADPFSKYAPNQSSDHYVVVYINTEKPRMVNKISGAISNYNNAQHSLDQLRISKMLYESKSELLMIKEFKGPDGARSYRDELLGNKTVFAGMDKSEYEVFVITKENFNVFYKDKDIKGYLQFHNQAYQ